MHEKHNRSRNAIAWMTERVNCLFSSRRLGSDFVFALTQRVALVLVVVLIAGGLFMFTYKSTQFNTQGFMLVLCASFLGGVRWTLTQILMQKAELGM